MHEFRMKKVNMRICEKFNEGKMLKNLTILYIQNKKQRSCWFLRRIKKRACVDMWKFFSVI